MNQNDYAALVRIGGKNRIFVALELIEEVATSTIRGLEAEALRTIRQKNLEKGHDCLGRIDGVQTFFDALKLAAGATIERQRGLVMDMPAASTTPVADRITEIRKRRKVPRALPKTAEVQS